MSFQSLLDCYPRDQVLDLLSDESENIVRTKHMETVDKKSNNLIWKIGKKEYRFVGHITSTDNNNKGWGKIFANDVLDYEGEVYFELKKDKHMALYDGFGTLFDKNGVREGRCSTFKQGKSGGPTCSFYPVTGSIKESGIWKELPTGEGSQSDGIVTMYRPDGSIYQRTYMHQGKWHGEGQAIVESDRYIKYTDAIVKKGQIICGRRIRINKETGTEIHMHGNKWLNNSKCLEGKELWFYPNGHIDMYPVSNGVSIFHAALNHTCHVKLHSFERDHIFSISTFLNLKEVNNLCQVSNILHKLTLPVLKMKYKALKKENI